MVASVGEKMLLESFTLDAKTGEVTLGADAAEVREEKNYVPLTGNETQEPETPTGVTKRRNENEAKPREEITMAKKETIDRLIACDCTRFAENDRAFLETLDEPMLDKLGPAEGVGVLPVEKPKPAENQAAPKPKENDAEPAKPEPVTFEALLAAAPPDVKNSFDRMLERDKAEKAAMVEGLMANSRNKFTKEQLDGFPVEVLENMATLGQVPVDYSGNGGPVPQENEDQMRVPDPPPLFEPKKA